MTETTLCLLLEAKMQPIPDNIKLLQNFGLERVYADSGKCLATGVVCFVNATKEAIAEWLRPFDSVWLTNSPMLGTWSVHHVKREII